MPLRKEQSWPKEKRKLANSILVEKDGINSPKMDDNSNEISNDSSINESSDSEQNKKV